MGQNMVLDGRVPWAASRDSRRRCSWRCTTRMRARALLWRTATRLIAVLCRPEYRCSEYSLNVTLEWAQCGHFSLMNRRPSRRLGSSSVSVFLLASAFSASSLSSSSASSPSTYELILGYNITLAGLMEYSRTPLYLTIRYRLSLYVTTNHRTQLTQHCARWTLDFSRCPKLIVTFFRHNHRF